MKNNTLNQERFTLLNALQEHPVAEHNPSKVYKKKEFLFEEGKFPKGVYCINQGKAKVFKRGHDGKEQIVHLAREGDVLGYRALMSNEPYPVSCAALEQCSIVFIPIADFKAILEDQPVLYERLLRQACRELGVMTSNMTNLAQKTVKQRLAIGLLMLKDIYSESESEVIISMTREDMANIVGTATESLIRLLNELKTAGVIESVGRKIKIVNVQELHTIANA